MLELEIGDDGISVLTLNRPEKHNAFDPALMQAIIDALHKLQHETDTRVLLLTGAGRSFSAGADLSYMKDMVNFSHEENVADAGRLALLLARLNEFPVPVIAAVNGYAMAGATGLIAASDIVVAADDARFAITEVKLGIAPAVISPYLIRRIGTHMARRYFLTAERFDAYTARDMGLVHEVVPAAELMPRARQFARSLLHNGPQALRATKTLIHTVVGSGVETTLSRYTCELIARLRCTEEAQLGLAAFFAREAPPWTPEDSKDEH